VTILLEVADISRFPSAEDFASYCRTVAAIKTSNGKKKADNNRKCGNRYLAWAFIEAANLIRRYDERAKRWHARKLAKSNNVIATKALACKLAKAAWHILSKGTLYDGDRLFGTAKAGPCRARKPFGRASVSQTKGLNRKSQGLIGHRRFSGSALQRGLDSGPAGPAVRTRWVTERIALSNIGPNIRNQGSRKTSFESHLARCVTR
jgi:hypothetical protein